MKVGKDHGRSSTPIFFSEHCQLWSQKYCYWWRLDN